MKAYTCTPTMKTTWTFIVVLFCLYSRGLAVDERYKNATELYERLLSTHNKYVSENIEEVWVEVYMEYLLGIDELEDKLTTVLSFKFSWRDDSLSWDCEKYPTRIVSLPDDVVWKPVVELANPIGTNTALQDCNTKKLVVINCGGIAFWSTFRRIDTRCEVDSTYFPFDEQFCEVRISFPGHKPSLKYLFVEDHLRVSEDGSWNIYGYKVWNEFNLYRWTATLVFEYQLRRKPLHSIINVILPIFILVSLAPLVFLLPKNAGDRLGLSITVLLALSVYMTIVTDSLPKTSDPIPIITVVLFVYYISNTLIVLLVLVNARICRISNSKVIPHCLKSFVLFTRRCFCQGQLTKNVVKACEESTGCNNTDTEARRSLIVDGEDCIAKDEQAEVMNKSINVGKQNDRNLIRWEHASSALDKWFIVFIYILKLIFAVLVVHFLLSGKGKPLEFEGYRELVYNSTSTDAV